MPDSDLTRPRDERAAAAPNLGERLARLVSDGEPPQIAAMQLLLQAETPAEAQAALLAAQMLPPAGALGDSNLPASRSASALRRIRDLIADNPGAWHTVHRVAASIAHRPVQGDALAHWANVFDGLVRLSPEGSVALYSLGDARLLEDATAEIVALLAERGLLDESTVVLDVGCGIGRLEAALAPHVASVYGIDISQAMLEEARRRCGHLANVRFALGSGSDLAGIADGSVDLLLLIDTLPYVMLSGPALAAKHFTESARVLERSGSLLVLNATYGGDADADLIELAQLAEWAGLEIHRADWRPLSSWDAPAFQLKHASRSPA